MKTSRLARAITATRLTHGGIAEKELAVDVDMWIHQIPLERVCTVSDETGEYVVGYKDRKRKMDGYRDWMCRHPARRAVWEKARVGAPLQCG